MSKVLVGLDALNFVKKYITIAKAKEFCSKKEVINHCKKFPVVLKISSEKVLHKTDAGGVVKIVNKEHLLQTLEEFAVAAKKQKISDLKFFIQEYVPGVELLLGAKKDPDFGHVVAFGIGGIFVELLKDVQFRAIPLTVKDAEDMVSQIKNKKILEGFRCLPKANKKLIIRSILEISRLVKEHPEIIELDINPLICTERYCKAVDVRLILKE